MRDEYTGLVLCEVPFKQCSASLKNSSGLGRLIVGEVATTARISVPAALIAGAASYFLGRHARRMDREYRAQRRRKVDEG